MGTLLGKSDADVRIFIATVAAQRGFELERLFVVAAAEHAPNLPKKRVRRAVGRFRGEGGKACAAPSYVRRYVQRIIEVERRDHHP